eukprot:scaffold112337_cov69-Phaeocystis_antarctica.AAC.4
MRSSPQQTTTTARTSPLSPWPTPRVGSSARSRHSCRSRTSSTAPSWPRLQALSRRSASNRTSSAGVCRPARRRQTARRPATRENTPRAHQSTIHPMATPTRTMQRVSSRRPPSAASSLARRPRLAFACPPDIAGVSIRLYSVSRRCPGGGWPHSAARQG